MAILMIFVLSVVTLMHYRGRRDLRYPPLLVSGLWLGVLGFYYVSPIPVDAISSRTSLIFLVAVLSFGGGAQIAFVLNANRLPLIKRRIRRPGPSLFHRRLRLFLLIASVCLLPVVYAKANALAEQSGFDDWLVGLRVELASPGSAGYGLLGNASMLSYFTTFIYAIEHGDKLKEKLQFYVSVVVSVAYASLSTGRTAFFLVLVALMGIAAMQGRLSSKKLLLGTTGFLACFAVFGVILSKGGTVDASWTDNFDSLEESVAQYTVGAIPAFDQIVRADAPLEYGRNTWLDILNLVRRSTGAPTVSPIHEEVDVPFSINVYTALHPPFKDFGIMGVIVAFAVIGAASTYFYLRAAAGEKLHVFYYSLSLPPLLFMTFSDQYFAPMLSWLKYAAAGYLYFRNSRWIPSESLQDGAAHRMNPTLGR